MGIYKRVSKHIRFDKETEDIVEGIINRVGNKQTFSGFVRNCVDKELATERGAYTRREDGE